MNPSPTEHYRALLRPTQGRRAILRIADQMLRDPQALEAVRALTRDPDRGVAWRALWACEKVSERDAERFASETDGWIAELLACRHAGSKRLLLGLLHRTRIEHLSVVLLDHCFELLASPDEAIAVRALAVKLACRLCKLEPALCGELRLLLETIDPACCSAALRSTIRQALRRL